MKYGGFRFPGAISLGQIWTESLPDVEDINYQRVFLGCVCVFQATCVEYSSNSLANSEKKHLAKKVQSIGISY